MKRFFTILFCVATTMSLTVSSAAAQKNLKSVEPMTKRLWNETSCLDFSDSRMELMTDLQYYFDRCDNFIPYLKCNDSIEEKKMEANSILGFYNEALNRLLREIPKEEVSYGHIAVWHLYNMGYVIKTPKHCFGIDLNHKYAEKLAPYIEFLCITHPHGDHYTDKLNKAMTDAGKPVYSNFLDNGYKLDDEAVFNPVGDIEIVAKRVHHGPNSNIVTYYQIDCGRDTRNKVIFHCGDAYDYTELEKTKDIDLFIPHTTVGLRLRKAAKKLDPDYVLLSHVLEMGHPAKYPGSSIYRIPYIEAIRKAIFLGRDGAIVPVWGEKMIF